MKDKKSKFRIRLFTPFEDGLTDTEIVIVRSKSGLYSISVAFYYSEDDVDPGSSCNYYQDNMTSKDIDNFVGSVSYTLVHKHSPSQSDITNILVNFDKNFNKSNSIEELIKNLKSDKYQSDSVYFVTKEIDEIGNIWYACHDLTKPDLTTGNSIADRILNNVYTELEEQLGQLKKVPVIEEEKEYIIKYVGGEDETN